VTALKLHNWNENAAKIEKKAFADHLSLKEAALELCLITEQQFDEWVVPKDMTGPLK